MDNKEKLQLGIKERNMIANIGLQLAQIHSDLKHEIVNEALKLGKVNNELISDGWHTFRELYEFRKIYNAILFNEWAKLGNNSHTVPLEEGGTTTYTAKQEPRYNVHKSWKHNNGKYCFDEEKKWFIVSAMLPTGLISNHYKAKDWDLFKVPEVEKALFEFDEHTGADVLERLKAL